MLRKFAAAVLASALLAAPALAQSAATAPGTAQGGAITAAQPAVKTMKTVKHMAKRGSKHRVRSKNATRHASHVKAGKTHHAGTAKSGKAS